MCYTLEVVFFTKFKEDLKHKKLFSVVKYLLVVSLIVSAFSGTALAEESLEGTTVKTEQGVEVKIVKDNKRFRITESTQDGVKSTATFDKKKKILTLEEDGKNAIVIDLNAIEEDTSNDATDGAGGIGIMATSGENTFSNYEYEIDLSVSPNKWELRRPQPNSFFDTYYKKVTETSSNRTNLNEFKKAVEDINSLEWQFIGYNTGIAISAALTVILTAVTAGGAVSTGLVALGLSGKALDVALKIHERCEDAHYYYFKV